MHLTTRKKQQKENREKPNFIIIIIISILEEYLYVKMYKILITTQHKIKNQVHIICSNSFFSSLLSNSTPQLFYENNKS